MLEDQGDGTWEGGLHAFKEQILDTLEGVRRVGMNRRGRSM